MDTTRKIIDTMILELSGFVLSDESKLPDEEYFLDKLNHYRSVSIRELQAIPESMYSESYCNEIKCDGESCTINGMTFTSPNKIHYVELGQLLDNVGWKNVRYFGLDGYRLNFTRKSLQDFAENNEPEYTLGVPYYTILNDYAIIKNMTIPNLKLIWVSALYSSPHSVYGAGLDQAYPCPDNILARAIRLVKMDVLHSLGINPNILNDNKDDSVISRGNEAPPEN